MLEQQERTALCLLIIVLATLSAGHLILAVVGNAPFAAPLSANSREGDLVVVTGVVEGITPTSSGGHLLVSVNRTRVFIPSPASQEVHLQVNETVRIYGIVQIYQGKREVAVRDARDVQTDSLP